MWLHVLCAPALELLNQLGFLKQGMNIMQFECTVQHGESLKSRKLYNTFKLPTISYKNTDTQTYEMEATVVSLTLWSWNDMTFAVNSYSDWNNNTFFGFWFDGNNSEALELDMWNAADTQTTSSPT